MLLGIDTVGLLHESGISVVYAGTYEKNAENMSRMLESEN